MTLEDFFVEVKVNQNDFAHSYEFSRPYRDWTDEEEQFFQDVSENPHILRDKGYDEIKDGLHTIYRRKENE